MTVLLDGNVLIALAFPRHVHHDRAHAWRTGQQRAPFATCPITQGTLLRLALREGASSTQALTLLTALAQTEGHEFWADDMSYAEVDLTGVVGHRQVTDAYLAALARRRGGRLVTLDAGFAALHHDVTELIPQG